MFNLFEKPYSSEDFEDWSKFCYDLAKVSAAGTIVTYFTGEYSTSQRVIYVIALLVSTYILALLGRKFRWIAIKLKKGGVICLLL